MRQIVKKMMMVFTAGMVTVLGLISPASSATYAVTQATTNGLDDISPKISNNGDRVWSYNGNIWIKDGNGSTKQLNNNGAEGGDFHVNDRGDIVWLQINYAELDTNVMLYTKLTDTIIRISRPAEQTHRHSDKNPRLNNLGQVVYQSYDGSDNEIMFYDGATVTQVTNNAVNDIFPMINDSGEIVWTASGQNGTDIWLRTAGTNTAITTTPFSELGPRINNTGDIVWSGWDGAYYQVWYYKKSTRQKTWLSSTAMDNRSVQINANGHIAWTGGTETSDYEIYFRNGLNGTTENVSNIASHDDGNPQINDNGWVTWQEDQGSDATNDQIFVWDGATRTRLQTDNYDHIDPMINNFNTVVWQGTGGTGTVLTDYEIFMATTGSNLCADAATRCNDNNICTTDGCTAATGACTNIANTLACNDGLYCNGADTCSNKVCGHAGNPCTAPLVCNETTDTCVTSQCTIANSATNCNDNNVCTTDGCNVVNGIGTCTNTANTLSCNDGLYCNGADTCSNKICGHAGNPCTAPLVCNETTDTCDNLCADAATRCNDNNVCTTDGCTAATGACTHTNNTASCDDGLFCTVNDACTGGICVSGGARNCSDSLACTTDSCNETTDTCVNAVATGCLISGVCIAEGTQNPANQCQACIGATSKTAYSNKTNGMTCNDNLFCTVTDTCQSGSCTGSGGPCTAPQVCDETTDMCVIPACVLQDCNDNNPCTDDSNNASAPGPGFCPCVHIGNTVSCNDNLYCNGADTCANKVCGHSGNPCAAGTTCNETADSCDNLCADAATRCNDNNVCTTDGCTAATGACTHTNNTASCNDALYCNGADTCSGGTCGHSGNPCAAGTTCNEATDTCDPTVCPCPDDGNPCTDDYCVNNVCTHPGNTNPCNDDLYCNGADTCLNGTCSAHGGNPCVAPAVCNEATVTCDCTRSITIRGGGQKSGGVDQQIMTLFTVTNGGCIVDYDDRSVTVTPNAVVAVDCHQGAGPHPSIGTWKGNPLPNDEAGSGIICPTLFGEEGILILTNKGALGGKDTDRMAIKVR